MTGNPISEARREDMEIEFRNNNCSYFGSKQNFRIILKRELQDI